MSELFNSLFISGFMEGIAERVKVTDSSLTVKAFRNGKWYRVTLYDTGFACLYEGGAFRADQNPVLTDYPKDAKGLERMFELAEELLSRVPAQSPTLAE